jgi:hypothetical protein
MTKMLTSKKFFFIEPVTQDLTLSLISRNVSNAEIRRQIHIQSEQKRRAQIKDGFDELRKHLPGCNNKKMSKAALLTRSMYLRINDFLFDFF